MKKEKEAFIFKHEEMIDKTFKVLFGILYIVYAYVLIDAMASCFAIINL